MWIIQGWVGRASIMVNICIVSFGSQDIFLIYYVNLKNAKTLPTSFITGPVVPINSTGT